MPLFLAVLYNFHFDTWKKSAAFLKPICRLLIISMACSKASSSESFERSIEIRWYSSPGFGCIPRITLVRLEFR